MDSEGVEHEVRLEGRVGNKWTVGGRWRRRGRGWQQWKETGCTESVTYADDKTA